MFSESSFRDDDVLARREKQTHLYSTTSFTFLLLQLKGVAADCLKAIRRKIVHADDLKQSVAKSLLLIIKPVSSKKDAADL
ncbi:hypothetical protein L1987_15460 [Smallanthus sonchifolius]|uniref:Uncharacterized protein n=1 Tax=Smallanthus sonchifolius TaxID=185202 RepID=A0ACB9J7W8_9ASTR|nr:hypothetical protein L1987_15460 [Smallanthus sonchifolius]